MGESHRRLRQTSEGVRRGRKDLGYYFNSWLGPKEGTESENNDDRESRVYTARRQSGRGLLDDRVCYETTGPYSAAEKEAEKWIARKQTLRFARQYIDKHRNGVGVQSTPFGEVELNPPDNLVMLLYAGCCAQSTTTFRQAHILACRGPVDPGGTFTLKGDRWPSLTGNWKLMAVKSIVDVRGPCGATAPRYRFDRRYPPGLLTRL